MGDKATLPNVTTPGRSVSDAVDMHIELRGNVPGELAGLASPGVCPRCDTGQPCVIAAAYLRISFDRYDDDHLPVADRGVVRQARSMIDLAVMRGAHHIVFFIDNDLSASKVRNDKAEWWSALRYVTEERPPLLIALKADRLSRRLADMERLEDLTREAGTTVLTVADGELFRSTAWPFIVAMAKTEAMNTSFRVRQAQAARIAKGYDTGGGNRPYGYAMDRMTVIEPEAAIIRECAKRIIKGESASAICRDLNARGIERTNKGKAWHPHLLRDMLSKPRYKGYRVLDGVEVVAAWHAKSILDVPTWETLQAALNEKQTSYKGGRPVSSLLGGIVRCGLCETIMTAAVVDATRKVYRCSTVAGGCGKIARSRDTIEAYVIGFAQGLMQGAADEHEGAELDARVEELSTENNRLELSIAATRQAHLDGRLSDADYFPTLDGLRKREAETMKKYRTAVVELERVRSLESAADKWDGWSTAERRRYLKSKMVTVLVHRTIGRGKGARVVKDGEIEIRTR